eukprot:1159714-Pelagomonas_calceolata.AAC.2
MDTRKKLIVVPPGKFYCPRMASMNKPAYAAIQVGGAACPCFSASIVLGTLTTGVANKLSLGSKGRKPSGKSGKDYPGNWMHSPLKPVLVFVSSRRQTRMTALDLITCAGMFQHGTHFLGRPCSLFLRALVMPCARGR